MTIDLGWLEKTAARVGKVREERDPLIALASTLGDLLQLEVFDRRLLLFALIFERRPRANAPGPA